MNTSLQFQSKWLLPVTGPPVKNAVMTVAGEFIAGVETRPEFDFESKSSYPGEPTNLASTADSSAEKPVIAKPANSIIVPGLMNLHSHLDYSKMPFNACPLFTWIEELVRATREWSFDDFLVSAREGADRALLTGTTALADSSYSGASAIAMAESGLKGAVGLELFGVDQDKSEFIFSHWKTRYAALKEKLPQNFNLTISPHSLYTVSPPLFAEASNWAKQQELPLLTHLAESNSEREWTETGDRRIDEYLQVVIPTGTEAEKSEVISKSPWKARGLSPVLSLEKMGCLTGNMIAAHVTCLDDRDRSALKRSGAFIAHCPRSNSNLSNGRMELEKILEEKIPVGLGTDSLASTETLSMLDEAASMIKVHGEKLNQNLGRTGCKTSEELALRLITIEPARALGIDNRTGSLEKGKAADFVIIEVDKTDYDLENLSETEVFQILFSGKAKVKDVFIDGRPRVSAGRIIR